jgi:DUF1365 family protein
VSVDLYEGWVRHRRFGSVPRSFRHRVFMTLSGGPRRTLEMPRSLGLGFNPVRFHFDMDGDEVASLAAEVTYTPWGERHVYELPGRHITCTWRTCAAGSASSTPLSRSSGALRGTCGGSGSATRRRRCACWH